MDKRILAALATCALYPYLDGADSGSGTHDGGPEANGAEFPSSIACKLLGVSEGQWSFTIGFEFGLALAAAITEDPCHTPDLTRAIADAKTEIALMEAEAKREAA